MIVTMRPSRLKNMMLHSFLLVVFLVTSSACVPAEGRNPEVVILQVPILASLGGDFPVVELEVLPKAQRMNPIGFIGSQQQLDTVLNHLQAGGKVLPTVDFSTQLVLYARNTVFYNRLLIAGVTLDGNTLEILSMSTLSAMPIREKVAVSLVVVPRLGAKYLKVAGEKFRLDGIWLHVSLTQMLQNLIDNVIWYMGKQQQPTIEGGSVRTASGKVMFVRDNGEGIAPEYLDNIFGLFKRLIAATEGSGVGLAIVKKVTSFHNGKVWVESFGEGEGSTFWIQLPFT